MLIPDLTWMQDAALSMGSVAAVLSLTILLMGLYSVITGKDHFPRRLRRLLWKVPASPDDQRTHGLYLMLNGAAILLMELCVTAGIYGSHSVRGFPADVMFFITLLGFCAAFALTVGAYVVGLRTRYVSSRASADSHPGIPPA